MISSTHDCFCLNSVEHNEMPLNVAFQLGLLLIKVYIRVQRLNRKNKTGSRGTIARSK